MEIALNDLSGTPTQNAWLETWVTQKGNLDDEIWYSRYSNDATRGIFKWAQNSFQLLFQPDLQYHTWKTWRIYILKTWRNTWKLFCQVNGVAKLWSKVNRLFSRSNKSNIGEYHDQGSQFVQVDDRGLLRILLHDIHHVYYNQLRRFRLKMLQAMCLYIVYRLQQHSKPMRYDLRLISERTKSNKRSQIKKSSKFYDIKWTRITASLFCITARFDCSSN